jgi:hypothetical protein
MHQITPGLWEWDMPHHRVLGLQFGRRLTIARLSDGTLWLNAPIKPEPDVVNAINTLGRVAHIVGPNTFHDAFLADSQIIWPQALLHGAPGLARANKKLRVDHTLTNQPASAWADVFDQHVMQGVPALNETVFLHHASRSLIIADLAFNFGPDRDAFSRFIFKLYGVQGRFKPSPLLKSVIKDRSALQSSLTHILSWDFDRIIVGHGTNIESGGKDALRSAYAFLR